MARPCWYRLICVLWILGGVAVLVWLGRSIELLPAVLSVLLIVGGLGSLAGVTSRARQRARARRRLGGGQIVFGVLALLWPDLTLLIAAVLFGVRTIIYGVALIWRAGRRLAGKPALARGSGAHAAPSTAAGCRPLRARGGPGRRSPRSAWWVNSWLADGAPVVDAFYDAPRIRPDEAGVLIRSDAYARSARRPAATVQRILYSTTDAVGCVRSPVRS